MNTPLPLHGSDATRLQDVLTRYVDSRDGYLQASKLVPQKGLAESFELIAQRRDLIASRVAELIHEQGTKPDEEGSVEAGIHRWWIRLRDKMTDQEADAILSECVRGEQELARTLQAALEDEHTLPEHREILSDALSEVNLAMRAFESAAEA
jgi:uncharacterized protein (TIGR02284 family)